MTNSTEAAYSIAAFILMILAHENNSDNLGWLIWSMDLLLVDTVYTPNDSGNMRDWVIYVLCSYY